MKTKREIMDERADALVMSLDKNLLVKARNIWRGLPVRERMRFLRIEKTMYDARSGARIDKLARMDSNSK